MLLIKLSLICLCCIISLSYFAQCGEPEDRLKKDTTAQSTIYKIKRLDINDKLTKQQKPQKQQQREQQQQQQQQHKQQPYAQQQQQQQQQQQLLEGDMPVMAAKPPRTKKLKNLAKNPHGLNKKLLNKLGFTKVKAPNSHNRKRLAIESRRHASPDDSHMFIIKLPPNVYYYNSPKAAAAAAPGGGGVGGVGGSGGASAKNALLPQPETEVPNANGKKVSFPFNSNGKPGRIYHWNLPVIKKILEDRQRFPQLAHAKKDRLIDIKDIPTWAKPWENDTVEKSYKSNYKKSLKLKSPSYYAPALAVNKNSFNKYFSGNGKPKGFYVIKENQKKPLYYKNIIS